MPTNASIPKEEPDEDYQERLKAALWYSVGKMVDKESLELNVNASSQFIGGLTEMAWTQLENTAKDLESFAHHANRSTITTDDVMMLARRNDGLEQVLRDCVEREQSERKKNATATAKGKGIARGKGVKK